MNILVVDDEPAVRRLHVHLLEQAGHTCHVAASCAEAVIVLAAEDVDLAIVDVGMPGENGLVLARHIQQECPKTACIMVTGKADFTSVSDARHAGAADYLVKPIAGPALIAAVDRVGARLRRVKPDKPAAPGAAADLAPFVRQPDIARSEPPIDKLFRAMLAAEASDLHLAVGMPPLIRKDGLIIALEIAGEPLSAEEVIALLAPIVPGNARKEFEARHDSDFAYEIPGLSRFRASIFMDRNGMAAAFRVVPQQVITAEEIGLTPAMLELCTLRKGLILITGPTGSGKSTTLSAMIDYINRTRSEHIISIEDPIEFVHANRGCLINQREVHSHTESFKGALRAALRADPDIVVIGEMRDLETATIALETAETGHLVFATLHTSTAASAVDRIIDQFDAERQPQIRVMLSESLRAVIAQSLCRKVGGGRVVAWELLMVNRAISNLIREGKTFQIPSLMQVSRDAGMVTLNDALMTLVRGGTVTTEEAMGRSADKPAFEALLQRDGLQNTPRATEGAR